MSEWLKCYFREMFEISVVTVVSRSVSFRTHQQSFLEHRKESSRMVGSVVKMLHHDDV